MLLLRKFNQNEFIFLVSILLLYLGLNAYAESLYWRLIVGIVFSVLILLGLHAIGHAKRLVRVGMVTLTCFFLLASWWDWVWIPHPLLEDIRYILGFLFFLVVTIVCLLSTLAAKRINPNVLCGAICTYLLIGLTWSNLYGFILHLNPKAFVTTAASVTLLPKSFVYYSFATITTLGYGDIIPVSDVARFWSWIEAFLGQVYLAILIAQLVGRYIVQNHSATKE